MLPDKSANAASAVASAIPHDVDKTIGIDTDFSANCQLRKDRTLAAPLHVPVRINSSDESHAIPDFSIAGVSCDINAAATVRRDTDSDIIPRTPPLENPLLSIVGIALDDEGIGATLIREPLY